MECRIQFYQNTLKRNVKAVIREISFHSTELSDGLVLISLLEGLTNKRISGYEKHPKTTAHKMVNLDIVLQFIANEKIKLIGIG